MIVTRQKHIPYYWILLAVAPWGASAFAGSAFWAIFIFSLKKYVENPAALAFILSLPGYASLIVAPVCGYLSDRIWTRFGRRKPFLIVSWTGTILVLLSMPFLPNLWCLIAASMAMSFFGDLGAPLEPLKQEIVPPHQRSLSTGTVYWMQNAASLVFYFVAVGRFNDVRFMGGHMLSGEMLIYTMGGLTLLSAFSIIVLGIKELKPTGVNSIDHRISIIGFFRAILDKDLWPVYLFNFGFFVYATGLGPLGNLLYTDQWHFTKQEFGINIAVGGVLNIFLIAILSVIANRLNRLKAYQFFMCATIFLQFAFFLYVQLVLPDRRPTLVELIVFGETQSTLATLMGLVGTPLLYDFIVRNKMGTFGAGNTLLGRFVGILGFQLMGLFLWAYAVLLEAPAGEMTRVCLKHDFSSTEVKTLIDQTKWNYPATGQPAKPSETHAEPWYATSLVTNHGTCWELRLHDKSSDDIKTQLEGLQGDLTPMLATKKMNQDFAEIERLKGNSSGAKAYQTKVDAQQVLIDQANGKITPLETELKTRSENFKQQVLTALKPELLADGDQIVSARIQDALVIDLPVGERPDASLEKTLVEMRRANLKVIDVRPAKIDAGYAISVSALTQAGTDETALAQKLGRMVADLSAHRQPHLFPHEPSIVNQRHEPALVMNLKVVENPLDHTVSPITRVANAILAHFDNAPQPERRMAATARSLRLNGESEQVGIDPVPDDEHQIAVTALLLPGAAKSDVDDALTKRLATLLGPQVPAGILPQARAFYDRVDNYAGLERITVQKPFITSSFEKLHYDYLAGYIGMFILGLVGLAITMFFAQQVKTGRIRRLGVEEAGDSAYAQP